MCQKEDDDHLYIGIVCEKVLYGIAEFAILQDVPRLVSKVGHPFFGHMLVNQAALLRAEQAMENV